VARLSAPPLTKDSYEAIVVGSGFGGAVAACRLARRRRDSRARPTRAGLTDDPELIRSRLETGKPPPLAGALTAEIGVFVSGHTHAPALTRFTGPAGQEGAIVNSGCWLRQLQPVPAHLGAPPVFVPRFVQTHVRVYRDSGAIQVELWEHPRRSGWRLRVAEWLAVVGRLPAEPDADAQPRVRARASVEVGQSRR
jgi:hypothetical protein